MKKQKHEIDTPQYYTVIEAAKIANVNPETIYRAIRQGKIKPVKVCGSDKLLRVTLGDILQKKNVE